MIAYALFCAALLAQATPRPAEAAPTAAAPQAQASTAAAPQAQAPTAAAPQAEQTPAEPTLAEAQEAAGRTAAGDADEDAARSARARKSHWAPVVRGQFGGKDDERTRRGQYRGQPLDEDDVDVGHSWAVVATWDLAQLVYSHDEAQLVLAHAHLARLRRQAADEAAQVWTERRRRLAALRKLSAGADRGAERGAEHGAEHGADRDEAALVLLRLTAELDALTGGLFHELLLREQAELEPKHE